MGGQPQIVHHQFKDSENQEERKEVLLCMLFSNKNKEVE